MFRGAGVQILHENRVLLVQNLLSGNWGFPKGHREPSDLTWRHTAVREVEEETGVDKLEITRKLQKTYHIFKRNGKYKLKITHWFEMQTNFEGTPFPQANEGIEKAVWLNPEQIKEALKNSYENIKLLFEEEKLLK